MLKLGKKRKLGERSGAREYMLATQLYSRNYAADKNDNDYDIIYA